jgi:hypothetical protein
LPRKLRRSILRVLQHRATPWEDGWTHESGLEEFDAAESAVLRETGHEYLSYPDEKKAVKGGFAEVVTLGYPENAMDLIEACLVQFPEETRQRLEGELNDVLTSHSSPWRVVHGQFVLIDSKYLEEEVLRPAADLLHVAGFDGPLKEFSEARSALVDGNNRDAIVAANNALESTIKALLGVKREKPGRLIARLVKSGLIPSHYDGFLDSLDKILYTVLVERSEPGRAHGSGKQPEDVPRPYAELAIHLVGVLIVFLLRQDAVPKALTKPAITAAKAGARDEEPPPYGDEDAPEPRDDEAETSGWPGEDELQTE